MFEYDSPITMIQKISEQIDFQIEQDCVSVVKSYGFNVNADELKRALTYDRQQYEKGFNDAKKHGHWNFTATNRYDRHYYCSECAHETELRTPYCPICGSKMDE